jgi:Flp pilus assembly protein TadD
MQPENPLETELCGVLSLLYARQGQHGEAMALLYGLVQRQPTQARVHVWRGWALYLADQLEQASVAAEAALACDPHFGEVHRLKAALKAAGGLSTA